MTNSIDPIVVAWQTHSRLNLQYIEAIPAEALSAKLGGKGRSIGGIIAHLHNNRLDWLKPGAPELFEGLSKVQRKETNNLEILQSYLTLSGTAVSQWLTNSLEIDGKVNVIGGHAGSLMGYLIAHESYHHGEIGLILGQAGFGLSQKDAYALWNWK